MDHTSLKIMEEGASPETRSRRTISFESSTRKENESAHIPRKNNVKKLRLGTSAEAARQVSEQELYRWLYKFSFYIAALCALGMAIYCVAYDTAYYTGISEKTYPDPDKTLIRRISYIHVTTGGIWILLSTLQVWTWFRQKYFKMHRVLGKLSILSAVISATSVFAMLLTNQAAGGAGMTYFGTLFGIIWILSIYFGVRSIRDGDVEKHKAHMLRAYVLSGQIVLMFPLIYIPQKLGYSLQESMGVTGCITWTVALILVEIYNRNRERRLDEGERKVDILNGFPVLRPKRHFLDFEILHRSSLTNNTNLVTLRLCREIDAYLATPPGMHYSVRATINGKVLTRSYSPLPLYCGNEDSFCEQPHRKLISFAIKRYPNGKMSTFLGEKAPIGSTVKILGPLGSFRIHTNQYSTLLLISAGTGITPLISVITDNLKNKTEKTNMKLLALNCPLKEQIIKLSCDRFSVHAINGGRAEFTRTLSEFDFEKGSNDVGCVICGPDGFMRATIKLLSNNTFSNCSRQKRDSYIPRCNIHAFGLDDR